MPKAPVFNETVATMVLNVADEGSVSITETVPLTSVV
jgi:hypothetical protein